ncbi:MAG TPA: hypothetical protein ENK53_09660, partial [Thiotrichales bacterium]|nr:hypothetical protein [Thiotrichales bacterium]
MGRGPGSPLARVACALEAAPTAVLAVMMPGGASVGEEEFRRRSRYAILGALNTHGLHPMHSERIQYVELPPDGAGNTIFVPYEIHVSEAPGAGGARQVLVLYLDEDALFEGNRPFEVLARWLDPFLQSEDTAVALIGPTSSD